MKNFIKSLIVESLERFIGSSASTNQFEAQVDMVKLWGASLFSSKNENLSPLISSLERGTLLGGCVDTPSYDDIRGGGRSFGEESLDPQLVSQSIDYPSLDSTYLKTYLLNIE